MATPHKLTPIRSHSQKKLQPSKSLHPAHTVNNRTKTYKNNFLTTFNEAQRSSNVYDLAHSLYTKKGSQRFAISLKNFRTGKGANPEVKEAKGKEEENNEKGVEGERMTQSLLTGLGRSRSPAANVLFDNLNKRTTMLVEYRKEIFTLEKKKDDLLNKIANLKRKIINEKKLKDKLIIQSDKHMNSTEHGFDYREKVKRESSKNRECQEENEEECRELVFYLTEADKRNSSLCKDITSEKIHIEQLESDIKTLIHTVFTENQQLTTLKTNLTVGLKAMKNSSDMIKYLESQKADLLLFVNKQIEENTTQQMV